MAKGPVRELLETVGIALAVALVVRTFVVQLYLVDGESMFPTLHHRDRLLVSKIVYHLRQPRAGEVVVLKDPTNPNRQLIKRVVAVEGETISLQERRLYVDGVEIAEPYVNPAPQQVADVAETPVPPGHIYVMGDNRGASLDSRIIGPIAVADVQGKAFFRFWPPDRLGSGPLDAPRTQKTGK